MRSRVTAPNTALKPRLSSLVLLLSVASPVLAAGEFYCCPDPSTGRRVCGDTIPAQCRGHGYRVLDSNGNVVKEVGPPLTPEQKAAQAIEEKRRKEIEDANREQRRRDQALLDTYTSLEDIDMAQKKAESDVSYSLKEAQSQLDTFQKKRNKLADEAEFYKKRTMPPDLARDLRAADHEIKLQQELIQQKQHDFDTIKAKYDADRKRYLELRSGRFSGSSFR